MRSKIIRLITILAILAVSLGSMAGSALAQDEESGMAIDLAYTDTCGEVQFTISWSPDTVDDYLFYMEFGDGDTTGLVPTDQTILSFSHTYLDQGDYSLYLEVIEADFEGSTASLTDTLILEGPDVTLSSVPFPPMFLAGEDSSVEYTAQVMGGTPAYHYQWDLNGDGVPEPDTGSSASYSYSEVGNYSAQVTVVDGCGFSGSASLPVVVAEAEDACHPMAQRIAEGVNSLFPDQAGQEYSCEDIYNIFDNDAGENNLGFGRMWMAYKLAQSVDLTWEEILAWHLDESGWGSLLQLNRFADVLEEQGIGDLMALVMSEDYTLSDVRTAVRSVTRYEADFEDALTRIADGATAGDLSQLYKLSSDLDVDPTEIDEYLADGMTLSEIKHAASFADRMDVDWTEIAEARVNADNWGDLKQAYSLATDEVSAADILAMGVQEYRKSLLEDQKAEKQEGQEQNEEQRNQQTADKLAEQYSAEFGDVMNLYNGECLGDWACVRSALREQSRTKADGFSEKDYQTAMQIASKYGSTEDEVLAYHQDFCQLDWNCTRAYFRNLYMETRETGKPKK